MVLICLRFNPLHPKMLCAKIDWYWSRDSGKEDFKFCPCIFRFVIISPWKWRGPSIKQTWIPFRRKFSFKFGWNLPSGSSNFVHVFSIFCYHVPLKKGVVLISILPRAKLVWFGWVRRRVNLFCPYLPLERDVTLHLNKLESPSPKYCFVPSLFEICPVVLVKKN